MITVLVATDADHVAAEVDAALAELDTTVLRVRAGVEVLPVVRQQYIDLVVLDLQIGNMGGIATCLELHLEEGAGRIEVGPILMVVDRDADVFLARRSEADGWLVKPIDAFRLRRAAKALLAGDTWFEGIALDEPVTTEPV